MLTAVNADPGVAAAKWRVLGWGEVVSDTVGVIKGWGVIEVEFYSNRACTKKLEIDPVDFDSMQNEE